MLSTSSQGRTPPQRQMCMEQRLSACITNSLAAKLLVSQHIHMHLHLFRRWIRGPQAPPVFQIHHWRDMQRLRQMRTVKVEREVHVVIPRRVRHLAHPSRARAVFPEAEVNLDWVLMVARKSRRCQQAHGTLRACRGTCLVGGQPRDWLLRPPWRRLVQVNQGHAHLVGERMRGLMLPRVRDDAFQKLNALVIFSRHAKGQPHQSAEHTPCSTSPMDRNRREQAKRLACRQ
mmetsp:Transcript_137587/g.439630  ORF Transcript_137587/g.439630 Transcript_137587/m.439630 type:complete len:231 (-) Transcript_137587:58-750(-)